MHIDELRKLAATDPSPARRKHYNERIAELEEITVPAAAPLDLEKVSVGGFDFEWKDNGRGSLQAKIDGWVFNILNHGELAVDVRATGPQGQQIEKSKLDSVSAAKSYIYDEVMETRAFKDSAGKVAPAALRKEQPQPKPQMFWGNWERNKDEATAPLEFLGTKYVVKVAGLMPGEDGNRSWRLTTTADNGNIMSTVIGYSKRYNKSVEQAAIDATEKHLWEEKHRAGRSRKVADAKLQKARQKGKLQRALDLVDAADENEMANLFEDVDIATDGDLRQKYKEPDERSDSAASRTTMAVAIKRELRKDPDLVDMLLREGDYADDDDDLEAAVGAPLHKDAFGNDEQQAGAESDPVQRIVELVEELDSNVSELFDAYKSGELGLITPLRPAMAKLREITSALNAFIADF